MVARQGQAATSRKGATAKHWKQHKSRRQWLPQERKNKTYQSTGRNKRLQQWQVATAMALDHSAVMQQRQPWQSKQWLQHWHGRTIKNDINKEKQQSSGKRHDDKWQWYSQRSYQWCWQYCGAGCSTGSDSKTSGSSIRKTAPKQHT